MTRVVAVLALGLGAAAHGFCPSYTLSTSSNDNNCGVEAVLGTNPTPEQWQPIFDLVSRGPAAWGSQGPSVADLGQGCSKPQAPIKVPAKFPCELLKAIAMHESAWKQFCVPDRPAEQVGGLSRTIISFDCGYGIGQVTSGMHGTDTPGFDRARVASEPIYNLATGTRILGGKWQAANCVGDNQPPVVEHWYTATWAYNGRVYSNNPSNPAYSSTRGSWTPAVGGSRPYQERVFGRMEYPKASVYWPSLPVAYPRASDCGSTGAPPDLPEPECASPTDCVNKRPTHVSSCFGGRDGGTDAGSPLDAGLDSGGGVVELADAGELDGGKIEQVAVLEADGGLSAGDPPEQDGAAARAVGCTCGSEAGALLPGAALLLALRGRKRRRSSSPPAVSSSGV